MPKRAKELGALDIKRLQHPGGNSKEARYAVGGVNGLLIAITPGGAKFWILRILVGSKRREIGLGAYPEVSIAEARDRARAARDKIKAGSDPIEERRAARAALAATARTQLTFEDAIDKWIEAKGAELSEKRRKTDKAALRNHAKAIAPMLVSEIDTPDILRVLTPIWRAKHETATNLRERIEAVLTWATVAGHRTGENPARWRGHLKELLPKKGDTEVVHHPAVQIEEMASWWRALLKCGGTGALALRLLTLTCARSGEVRGATWKEIDLPNGRWIIPAARMQKNGKEHRVALSKDAVAILKVMQERGGQYVFPAVRGGMLSDATLSKVMKDMHEREEKAGRRGWIDRTSGRPAVPHGLRSTFRDWAAETGKDRDLAEMALSHIVGDDVERAYRRSDMFERRRELSQQWADFVSGREAISLVPAAAGSAA